MGAARSPSRPYRLVILRHGESEWNAANRFTGWVNVALSPAGEREAARAGRLLARRGLLPGFVHTSVQRRAISTAGLALAECDRDWIPVRRSWRLNSNHYGALQGRSKDEVRAEAGEEQFMRWRRSYDAAPPPLDTGSEYSQFGDARYAAVPPGIRPRTESLKDVTIPDLRSGQCVLVVSHGNTVRALVKHLERMSDEEVTGLNVPTATPLAYELGPDFHPSGPRVSW